LKREKNIGFTNQELVKLLNKSNNEIEEQKKEVLRQQIHKLISDSENTIRNILLGAYNYNDELFINSIKDKLEKYKNSNAIDLLEKWRNVKSRALNRDSSIIYYADFNHLIPLLSWCKIDIGKKYSNSPKNIREEFYKKIKELINQMEFIINPERNESFHSRLQILKYDELNAIFVDVSRFNSFCLKIKEDLDK